MTLSEVEVARRLHLAGFLFLPWLWLVSSVHYYPASKTDPELAYYVKRNMIWFVIYTAAFLAWLVVFQVHWREWGELGTSLLVVAMPPSTTSSSSW